ncbi:hypothetical protein RsS62_08610 [Rhizobium dioscoreae]|nr:hypothetical protein RsS62_08610 [Rhizobium dioscoreae]
MSVSSFYFRTPIDQRRDGVAFVFIRVLGADVTNRDIVSSINMKTNDRVIALFPD